MHFNLINHSLYFFIIRLFKFKKQLWILLNNYFNLENIFKTKS